MNIQTIKTLIAQEKEQLTRSKLILEQARTKLATTTKAFNDADITATFQKQIQLFLEQFSKFKRMETIAEMNKLGTFVMQSVFGMNYSLSVKEDKGGKITVEVSEVIGDTVLETLPEDENGGGVSDVVGLALRFIMLNITEPKSDGPIMLDEPGKHVSSQYSTNLAKLLEMMSVDFNRQVIVNTHKPEIWSLETEGLGSRIYLVERHDGVSQVETIR